MPSIIGQSVEPDRIVIMTVDGDVTITAADYARERTVSEGKSAQVKADSQDPAKAQLTDDHLAAATLAVKAAEFAPDRLDPSQLRITVDAHGQFVDCEIGILDADPVHELAVSVAKADAIKAAEVADAEVQ